MYVPYDCNLAPNNLHVGVKTRRLIFEFFFSFSFSILPSGTATIPRVMHLMRGFEYTDQRLVVPFPGRYGCFCLILLVMFVFYLFYPSPSEYVPSPSKYVPSAHLEGGEPWAKYYHKGQGLFFIILVIYTFVNSYVPCFFKAWGCYMLYVICYIPYISRQDNPSEG